MCGTHALHEHGDTERGAIASVQRKKDAVDQDGNMRQATSLSCACLFSPLTTRELPSIRVPLSNPPTLLFAPPKV